MATDTGQTTAKRRPLCSVFDCNSAHMQQDRPHHVDDTTSRPLSEVKRRWVVLVPRGGGYVEIPGALLFSLFDPPSCTPRTVAWDLGPPTRVQGRPSRSSFQTCGHLDRTCRSRRMSHEHRFRPEFSGHINRRHALRPCLRLGQHTRIMGSYGHAQKGARPPKSAAPL